MQHAILKNSTPRKVQIIRISTIILVTVVTIGWLVWSRPQPQARLQPPQPPRVLTDIVRQVDLRPTSYIIGKLLPSRQASLSFEIPGRVTNRSIEPGQDVTLGGILLQVDDGDFVDIVEEAEALLEQEKMVAIRDRKLLDLVTKSRTLQQTEVARLDTLGRESLATRSIYDAAVQNLLQQQQEEARLQYSTAASVAKLKSHRAVLNRARRNLDRTRLTAPFSGRINSVSVEIGDYVSANQVVVELLQLDKLELLLDAPGSVSMQLSLGQRIKIKVKDQQTTGEIIAIAANADPVTHTYEVRISLAANGFYAGQLAEAELPGDLLPDAAVVPLTAILREAGQAHVFVVQDTRVVRQPVELVRRYQNWQVIDGLKPGVKIVVRDVSSLADGQIVAPQ